MKHNPNADVDHDHIASHNVAVVRGTIRDTPIQRELPSGGLVVQFDVSTPTVGAPVNVPATTDADRSPIVVVNVSVPVAWSDPPAAAIAALVAGAEVVVVGSVRRRFFRVGGATQSRTEVVADSVIPARRRAKVTAALGEVASRLVS
jgi:single-strand DNA-binding protein